MEVSGQGSFDIRHDQILHNQDPRQSMAFRLSIHPNRSAHISMIGLPGNGVHPSPAHTTGARNHIGNAWLPIIHLRTYAPSLSHSKFCETECKTPQNDVVRA